MSYRNMHLLAPSTQSFQGALPVQTEAVSARLQSPNSSRDLSLESNLGVAVGNADMPSPQSLDGTLSQLGSTGQSYQISVTHSPKMVARHAQPIFQAIGFNQSLFLG